MGDRADFIVVGSPIYDVSGQTRRPLLPNDALPHGAGESSRKNSDLRSFSKGRVGNLNDLIQGGWGFNESSFLNLYFFSVPQDIYYTSALSPHGLGHKGRR